MLSTNDRNWHTRLLICESNRTAFQVLMRATRRPHYGVRRDDFSPERFRGILEPEQPHQCIERHPEISKIFLRPVHRILIGTDDPVDK